MLKLIENVSPEGKPSYALHIDTDACQLCIHMHEESDYIQVHCTGKESFLQSVHCFGPGTQIHDMWLQSIQYYNRIGVGQQMEKPILAALVMSFFQDLNQI